MKPRDVAHLYNVEPETVVEWARAGIIPSLRTPGGQYRFRPADMENLLHAPANAGPMAAPAFP